MRVVCVPVESCLSLSKYIDCGMLGGHDRRSGTGELIFYTP